MTRIYFVRHAEPDRSVHDDRTRPLTEEGIRDSLEVTRILKDKSIDFLISSPYKRSMDTIGDLSKKLGKKIQTDDDFRERNAGGWHGENFLKYIEKQWEDFNYHIQDGESLNEVQSRNIRALRKVLSSHKDENIVIATHGTALSTILNFYYPQYDFECFMKIIDFMPFVIRLDFEGEEIIGAQVELVIRKEFKR